MTTLKYLLGGYLAVLSFACAHAQILLPRQNVTGTLQAGRKMISCPLNGVRLPMKDCDGAFLQFPHEIDPFVFRNDRPTIATQWGRCGVTISLQGSEPQRTSWPFLFSSLVFFKTSCTLSNLDIKPGAVSVGPNGNIVISVYEVPIRYDAAGGQVSSDDELDGSRTTGGGYTAGNVTAF